MATLKRAGIAGALCSVAIIIGLVVNNGNVRTNQRGLELIGNAEGCRREPYKCPADVLTDGIGNTHGVKSGTRKADQQIAADWEKNILEAERCVDRYANGRSLPENTFSSAVEVTFNLGCPAMQKSTMFWLYRQGQLVDACNQLPRWVYVNGVKSNGLERRRAASKALCLDGLK